MHQVLMACRHFQSGILAGCTGLKDETRARRNFWIFGIWNFIFDHPCTLWFLSQGTVVESRIPPISVGNTRRRWPSSVARESLLFLVTLSVGVIITLLGSYPDTTISIGVDSVDEGGRRVPAVLLDFDTPTVEQMLDFKSHEEFDQWVIAYARSSVKEVGFVSADSALRLVRVPDLLKSPPKKLFVYRVPRSGSKKLLSHLFGREYFADAWSAVLLPSLCLFGARVLFWSIRTIRSP
jgi:hypothetical protein